MEWSTDTKHVELIEIEIHGYLDFEKVFGKGSPLKSIQKYSHPCKLYLLRSQHKNLTSDTAC